MSGFRYRIAEREGRGKCASGFDVITQLDFCMPSERPFASALDF